MHMGISDLSFVCGCRKICLRKNPPNEIETRSCKNCISTQFQTDLTKLVAEND